MSSAVTADRTDDDGHERAGSRPRSVLRDIAPTPGRWAGAVAVVVLGVGFGWFVGAGWTRAVLAALALAVLVLVSRLGEPAEAAWPDRPAARTRPGLHVVATTQRQLEGARTDPGDRAAVAARLARLGRTRPPTGRSRP